MINHFKQKYMDIKQKVGFRVKTLADKSGLSITYLAWDAGLSPSYINDVIRGERNISLTAIQKICTAVGISVSEFFNDNEFLN
jgi:transcriptional regulator with XRE-family HTH domain